MACSWACLVSQSTHQLCGRTIKTRTWCRTDYCVPSAAVQARQRLGREPLAALFSLISQAWFDQSQQQYSTFQGLRVCAVLTGGLVLPLTKENFNHFGSSKGKTAVAPYPQVRAAC